MRCGPYEWGAYLFRIRILIISNVVVEPWFAAVPVPTSEKFWFRFRIQTIFSIFSITKKLHKILPFQYPSEAAYFSKMFWFLFRLRFRIQTIFSTVFKKQKISKILPFQYLSEAAYFSEICYLNFNFLKLFFITFYVGSRSKSGSDTRTVVHSGSCDSGSGSKTLISKVTTIRGCPSCTCRPLQSRQCWADTCGRRSQRRGHACRVRWLPRAVNIF